MKVGCNAALLVPVFLQVQSFNDCGGDPRAALARKRKQVLELWSDVIGERITEQATSAMQACLDGFLLKVEGCGRLLHAEAFDDPGNEHDAEFARKLDDRLLDELTELSLRHGTLRIDGRWGSGEGNNLGSTLLHIVADVIHRYVGVPAQPLIGFVEHDAREPGGEACLSTEVGKRGEGSQIGLLKYILGLAVVAYHAPRDPVESAVVPLHQNANSLLVLAQHEVDEICVGSGINLYGPRPGHDCNPGKIPYVGCIELK